jgi:hypothetical protein
VAASQRVSCGSGNGGLTQVQHCGALPTPLRQIQFTAYFIPALIRPIRFYFNLTATFPAESPFASIVRFGDFHSTLKLQ